MNTWGKQRIPFLFIINYSMNEIELFRLDRPLPGNIRFSLQESLPGQKGSKTNEFIFKKYPVTFHQYKNAFYMVQNEIQKGNSYLVNLTFPTLLETNLTLKDIYSLSKASYKLLMDGRFVCFSPETFIRIDQCQITTCPMKGTINACVPDAEKVLLESRKETAEHCTIVDLLRNDLSMIANDVGVKRFRYIDRIETNEGTLLQVSSSISGVLDSTFNKYLGDIIFALLPAGSVTGAPKQKTIQIITDVEKEDRGYYTGVFGLFDGSNLDSAVMIRFIEIREGVMYYRSGGGITSLSNAWEEYIELIDKVYVPLAGNHQN